MTKPSAPSFVYSSFVPRPWPTATPSMALLTGTDGRMTKLFKRLISLSFSQTKYLGFIYTSQRSLCESNKSGSLPIVLMCPFHILQRASIVELNRSEQRKQRIKASSSVSSVFSCSHLLRPKTSVLHPVSTESISSSTGRVASSNHPQHQLSTHIAYAHERLHFPAPLHTP